MKIEKKNPCKEQWNKRHLELRPDFEYVQDISNTINQENILVLIASWQEIFDMDDLDIEEILEELGEEIDESISVFYLKM